MLPGLRVKDRIQLAAPIVVQGNTMTFTINVIQHDAWITRHKYEITMAAAASAASSSASASSSLCPKFDALQIRF